MARHDPERLLVHAAWTLVSSSPVGTYRPFLAENLSILVNWWDDLDSRDRTRLAHSARTFIRETGARLR